jgi:hypothetical protein
MENKKSGFCFIWWYCSFVGLFVCFSVLGFELKAFTLSHSTSPFFVMVFYEIGARGTICLGWL